MFRYQTCLLGLGTAVGLLCCAALVQCAPLDPSADGDLNQYDVLESSKPELFEGDIAGLIPIGLRFSSASDQHQYLRKAARNGILKGRWKGSVMPYEISAKFTAKEQEQILKAVAEINGHAAHFFIKPKTDEEDYVFITRGGPNTGCWSYVGDLDNIHFNTGKQLLNLQVQVRPTDNHCMFHGTIVHELIHAVGFFHEQSRTDRDEYVEINWDNIYKEQHHNFDSYNEQSVTHFQRPYNFDSIMHYGKYDFAIDRTVWTIRPKAPNQDLEIGQQRGMNEEDVIKLNNMYPN